MAAPVPGTRPSGFPYPVRLYTLRGAWRGCSGTNSTTAMRGAGRTRWTRRLARPQAGYASICESMGP